MSVGKTFETQFAKPLREQCKDSIVIQRLYDNMSKFALHYPSDYILFTPYGSYYIECKATEKDSFYFSGFAKHQIEEMVEINNNKANVTCYVVIFFYKGGITKAFNMSYINKLIENGEKKVRSDDINAVVITGKKKRTYFVYDMMKFIYDLRGDNYGCK